MLEESKTELYWCVVGNKVGTHFLYKDSLSHFEYSQLCDEAIKEVYGLEQNTTS